ncbi:uncharacterized protein LOC133374669 [Rhineura floridana]|uniref:uncharacterized protein LOC133374669 n=1 Tax=Rhineura floridana TaxID=261503 RepID=UPI002AC81DB5|nr:uncharacterized protein LOC133374669 [Rhineura floridana]XP_061461812.1 uncharacterized protein LOC133374669 [Rhineura floridana]
MQDHLKKKRKPQPLVQPATSFPPVRQPSGYSSASFYDYTSLSPSTESTSSPGFEYSGSSESEYTSISDSTSPSCSTHKTTSSASLVVISSSEEHTEPLALEYSSSSTEHALSFESGPSPKNGPHSALGDTTSSPACSSGLERWAYQSLARDGDPGGGWLVSPPPSAVASPKECCSPTVSFPGSGPSRPPSREGHQENISGPATESESDSEGPVRLAVYSPHITLKDLRGHCGCWHKGRQSELRNLQQPTYGKAQPSTHFCSASGL